MWVLGFRGRGVRDAGSRGAPLIPIASMLDNWVLVGQIEANGRRNRVSSVKADVGERTKQDLTPNLYQRRKVRS